MRRARGRTRQPDESGDSTIPFRSPKAFESVLSHRRRSGESRRVSRAAGTAGPPRDVRARCRGTREIGDRAAHTQNAVASPGAEAESLDRSLEQPVPPRVQTAVLTQRGCLHLSVQALAPGLKPFLLPKPGGLHARMHRGGRLFARGRQTLRRNECRHLDHQIHAIPQRSRDPVRVTLHLEGRAATRPPCVSAEAAWASRRCLFAVSSCEDGSRSRRFAKLWGIDANRPSHAGRLERVVGRSGKC